MKIKFYIFIGTYFSINYTFKNKNDYFIKDIIQLINIVCEFYFIFIEKPLTDVQAKASNVTSHESCIKTCVHFRLKKKLVPIKHKANTKYKHTL